jgi:hypothetical protein
VPVQIHGNPSSGQGRRRADPPDHVLIGVVKGLSARRGSIKVPSAVRGREVLRLFIHRKSYVNVDSALEGVRPPESRPIRKRRPPLFSKTGQVLHSESSESS